MGIEMPKETVDILTKDGWEKVFNGSNELIGLNKSLSDYLLVELRHFGPWEDAPETYQLYLYLDYSKIEDFPLEFNGDGEYTEVISSSIAFGDIKNLDEQIRKLKNDMLDGLYKLIGLIVVTA